jgi:hypothetical protein
MIIDDKSLLLPPPPYFARPTRRQGPAPTLSTLPSHILLHIVYSIFPQQDGLHPGDGKLQLQRQTLHWIHSSLRFVNRALYIASMHILRSTYLPIYDSLIRPPYSSDPFPSSHYESLSSQGSSIFTHHRERPTLDLFIAVLAHEDVLQDSSVLHLPREEAYKDIFDLIQPRSRLEDLVFDLGRRYGVVSLNNPDGQDTPPPSATPRPGPSGTSAGGIIEGSFSVTSPIAVSKEDEDSAYRQNNPYTFSLNVSPPPSVISLPLNSTSSTRTNTIKSKHSFSFLSSLFKGKSSKRSQPTKSTSLPLPPIQTTYQRPVIRDPPPLPFASLSVSFTTRQVGLIYTPPLPPPSPNARSRFLSASSSSLSASRSTLNLHASGSSTPAVTYPGGRKRTVVSVSRSRDESLEVCARRLVRGLKDWLEEQVELGQC